MIYPAGRSALQFPAPQDLQGPQRSAFAAPAHPSSPLSPAILAQAKVPLNDAMWLHCHPGAPLTARLQTERGALILNKVRQFLNPTQADTPTALAA
ncbi:hypothetical protein LJR118_006652 [Acidovorax sp. LjRoot118]|uniref:hypothetical protein n=1 Tax=Acidovorax sp. LjRoot118 TaxID=3342256 RepID=UPI003ECF89EE